MGYFPLFPDILDKDILVVGAGAVGKRKVLSLLACGPGRLWLADPALADADADNPDFAFLRDERLRVLARPFAEADLEGKFLVFAASSDKKLNTHIARRCAALGILCNCAAPPNAGDCIVPAHFTRQGLTVTVNTNGQSPALARLLREELEAFVASRYTLLLGVMARLRPLLLELGLPTDENSALFRSLIRGDLAALLDKGDAKAAERLLREHLPQALHSRLGEILHGL